MLREVVESSSLVSMGYDRGAQTLEIDPLTGGLYRYAGVPPEVWSGLRQATSKGQFFQDFVRDRFEAVRVA